MNAGNGKKYLYNAVNRKRDLSLYAIIAWHMPEWCASPLEGRLCCLESCVKPFSWLPMTGPSFEMRAASFAGRKRSHAVKGDLPGLTLYPDSFLLKIAK